MNVLPDGFGIRLAGSVRRYGSGRLLVGGSPLRVTRLSDSGARALAQLERGAAASPAARELARRLIDGGLAAPVPEQSIQAPAATVVIPVRDRPEQLERCLAALGGPDAAVVVVDDGSARPQSVRAACDRHRARCIRRERSGGPGVARNTGLAAVRTELVAFLDSDAIAGPGWLEQLGRHFADPTVGAVAPRVLPVPRPGRQTVRERYLSSRSPLDLGPAAGEVGPGRPIAYVPTAAMIVRREALNTGFDETLRYGEDVDLVWRLRDRGWTVRYDPAVTVRHQEPSGWRPLLGRRYRYGTSAAALSRRHPGLLAPVTIAPRPAAAVALALCGRLAPAAAVACTAPLPSMARLRRAGVPAPVAYAFGLSAVAKVLLGVSRAAPTVAAPVLLGALALRRTPRRTRWAAVTMLAAAPASEWLTARPRLDPLRWTAIALADDLAYGLGVWRGCLRHRTAEPLRPRFARPAAST